MQDPRIGFSEAHAIHPTHLVCLVACTSEAYCKTEKKKLPGFLKYSGVCSVHVCGFCHSTLQSFKCVSVCVERGHTCAYTKLTFYLHHARHSCSIFTALWCGCSFVKLTFYLHHTPIMALARWHNRQTMPGLHCITDTRQVCEYPDSTKSKVLTVLKWWMITMFNRKLLEKQSVLLPMRYTYHRIRLLGACA